MPEGELKDHVVLITGSSRGIGAATARLAHHRGARVILHARAVSPQLLALADELGARYLTCDVTDEQAVAAAVAGLLEREPTIHALINCAGNVSPKPFLGATAADWLAELNVNLLGTVYFCQALAPAMTATGYGRIVNVTSIRGEAVTASARIMAYSAAKAAVANFTVSLAKELAPAVNVNAVAPGFTRTAQSEKFTEAVWSQVRSALSGRIAEPEDIAEALLFLASERARFITGQTLVVDGGYTIAGK